MFGFISKIKDTISKTQESIVDNVLNLVAGKEIDDFVLDEIEEALIKADIGVNTSAEVVDAIRNKKYLSKDELKNHLKNAFLKIIGNDKTNVLNYKENTLNIYFITGVNGAGKTTLIGKLAHRFKKEGKKVLIAAGDTFRAAAEEQLEIWAQRAEVDIVVEKKKDAASVVFDSVRKAKEENYNVLLIDTAGRLQNKYTLMEELKKIKNVVKKQAEENLSETILVIDATTGQNGLSQAKVFTEATEVTSIALTKFDGSAKGGIIINIAKEFNLPVKLVGVGEKIDDLENFDSNLFLDSIFN